MGGENQRYLMHYGVLGMKWGIRRYQNKDGTLTSAGKTHYSSSSSQSERSAYGSNREYTRDGKTLSKIRADIVENKPFMDGVKKKVDGDKNLLKQKRKWDRLRNEAQDPTTANMDSRRRNALYKRARVAEERLRKQIQSLAKSIEDIPKYKAYETYKEFAIVRSLYAPYSDLPDVELPSSLFRPNS